VTTAIVYIPPGIEHDFQYAREGIDHLERRGCRFGGIFRSMDNVRQALRNGASIVVFARQSHWDPDMRVPAEIVGDETRRLAWAIPPKDRLTERRPSAVGEQTKELTRPPVIPPPRARPRNDRAAQLVEEAARRAGFPPATPPSYRWGPGHN
jgi:hypothetical protein